MNAPPKIDRAAAHSGGDVVHSADRTKRRDEHFLDNIFAELCVRLQRDGIPRQAGTLHILISHPQWLGARMMWADGMQEAEIARVDYDVEGAIQNLSAVSLPKRNARTTAPLKCTRVLNAIPSPRPQARRL